MYVVYGGAFNPLTKAHIEITNKILKTYPNSKVIIVPVGNDYNKPELIDFNHRFNMLKLAFKDNKNVIISKIENSKKYLGTLNTLNKLSEKYNNLHFLIGSDNLININKWIKYQTLLKTYPLVIVKRDNINIIEILNNYKHLNIKYDLIEFNSQINSTKIRNNINKYKNWLNKDIYKYIKNNKLYGSDQNV